MYNSFQGQQICHDFVAAFLHVGIHCWCSLHPFISFRGANPFKNLGKPPKQVQWGLQCKRTKPKPPRCLLPEKELFFKIRRTHGKSQNCME